jgi:uncharacterized protein (TIGR00730 family)
MSPLEGGPRPVSLADEEGVKDIVVTTILGLWDAVNNLTRLRPSKRERYRVTIFGSARAPRGTFPYEETKVVAKALAEMGCDIITGGGPGLMSAANEGASEAGAAARDRSGSPRAARRPQMNQSIGIRVDLPFEQDVNSFVGQVFEHRTFFTRLHHFVLASDAFVVAPGGIGTVLETMMIWQLLQVKHLENTPLILVGRMWKDLVEWARAHMLDARLALASVDDMSIPQCVSSGAEATRLLREHHEHWQRERRASGA